MRSRTCFLFVQSLFLSILFVVNFIKQFSCWLSFSEKLNHLRNFLIIFSYVKQSSFPGKYRWQDLKPGQLWRLSVDSKTRTKFLQNLCSWENNLQWQMFQKATPFDMYENLFSVIKQASFLELKRVIWHTLMLTIRQLPRKGLASKQHFQRLRWQSRQSDTRWGVQQGRPSSQHFWHKS